jgi:wyosine [tRNA(Phe)-imidazoG37] synthetase (radical SAM superfamily)
MTTKKKKPVKKTKPLKLKAGIKEFKSHTGQRMVLRTQAADVFLVTEDHHETLVHLSGRNMPIFVQDSFEDVLKKLGWTK